MDQNIKNTAKKDQRIARSYAAYAYGNRRWTYTDIFDAYERPSVYKIRAWDYCKRLCEEKGGSDLIITGKNCMKFSACFKFKEAGTGRDCVCYITKDYDRYAYAEEAC